VRGLYPKGHYLGIVNQKVVADGPSRYLVENTTHEAFLKWTGGINTDIIPTIVLQVGHEDEKSAVIVIEIEIPNSVVAFHPSGARMVEWKGVAKPVANELEVDLALNRFWCSFRFVGPDYRPYITLAVSRHEDSYCFPMTFFMDTGSPYNFIKRSVFDRIDLTERPAYGDKKLCIGGNRYFFRKPGENEVHNNINVIGTSVIYHCSFIKRAFVEACSLLELNPSQPFEPGRGEAPEPGDWK